jgi:protein NRD1
MATDQGGKRGPQSTRTQPDRFRRPERGTESHNGGGGYGGSGGLERDASSVNNPAVPPAVPGFGFQFPGMQLFPPGFMMGGAQPGSSAATQPPPPGQGN